LLKADVTANDQEDQALMRHFGIFGPPAYLFFGRDGQEQRNYRVVGYMSADEFADHLEKALRP
jgi:thiol:disulfide interchange protein DsbD